MKRRIRLRGINGDIEGKNWESETLLRAGRLATVREWRESQGRPARAPVGTRAGACASKLNCSVPA